MELSSQIPPNQEWLLEILKEIQLEQFYVRLRDELQLTKIEHFEFVQIEDLTNIGISKPAARRLLNHINKLNSNNNSGSNKFKSIFFSNTNKSQSQINKKVENKPCNNYNNITCLIQEKDLKLFEKLGDGNFGIVLKGYWKNNTLNIPVAVKILKEDKNNNSEILQDFIKEVPSMHKLNHCNIIRLFGIVLSNPLMMITEFADHGALSDYMKKYNESISFIDIWNWILQITLGVEYLQSQRCIHRDLALRNIFLVSSNSSSVVSQPFASASTPNNIDIAVKKTIKIGDFGLMRFLPKDSNHYIMQERQKIPIPWSSPESLKTKIFSHSSDIWMYGMTIWEVLTLGTEEPWNNLNHSKDILNQIDMNKRPYKPYLCPVNLYQILLQCWSSNPEERPKIKNIYRYLHENYPITMISNQSFNSNSTNSDVRVKFLENIHENDTITIIDHNIEFYYWKGQKIVKLNDQNENKIKFESGLFPRNILSNSRKSNKVIKNDISKPLRNSFIHTGHGTIDTDAEDKNLSWGSPYYIDKIYLNNPMQPIDLMLFNNNNENSNYESFVNNFGYCDTFTNENNENYVTVENFNQYYTNIFTINSTNDVLAPSSNKKISKKLSVLLQYEENVSENNSSSAGSSSSANSNNNNNQENIFLPSPSSSFDNNTNFGTYQNQSNNALFSSLPTEEQYDQNNLFQSNSSAAAAATPNLQLMESRTYYNTHNNNDNNNKPKIPPPTYLINSSVEAPTTMTPYNNLPTIPTKETDPFDTSFINEDFNTNSSSDAMAMGPSSNRNYNYNLTPASTSQNQNNNYKRYYSSVPPPSSNYDFYNNIPVTNLRRLEQQLAHEEAGVSNDNNKKTCDKTEIFEDDFLSINSYNYNDSFCDSIPSMDNGSNRYSANSENLSISMMAIANLRINDNVDHSNLNSNLALANSNLSPSLSIISSSNTASPNKTAISPAAPSAAAITIHSNPTSPNSANLIRKNSNLHNFNNAININTTPTKSDNNNVKKEVLKEKINESFSWLDSTFLQILPNNSVPTYQHVSLNEKPSLNQLKQLQIYQNFNKDIPTNQNNNKNSMSSANSSPFHSNFEDIERNLLNSPPSSSKIDNNLFISNNTDFTDNSPINLPSTSATSNKKMKNDLIFLPPPPPHTSSSASSSKSDLSENLMLNLPSNPNKNKRNNYNEHAYASRSNSSTSKNNSKVIMKESLIFIKKLIPNITEEEIIRELTSNEGNLLLTERSLKIKILLNLGIGSKAKCESALLSSNWNVETAANILLS